MKSRLIIWLAVGVVVFAMSVPTLLTAQGRMKENQEGKHHHYKVIDMGTFGGPASGVNETTFLFTASGDINIREMIGTSTTSVPITATNNPNACSALGFVAHAFVWHMDIVTDLGTLSEADNCSTANAIDSNGMIVGASETDEIDPLLDVKQQHAVQWKDGRIADLGTLGGYESIATDINNQGLVVGGATNAISDPLACSSTQCRAALWRNGVIQDLGTLGGPEALAPLINGRDQITGAANTDYSPTGDPLCFLARTTHPFLWERGRMTDLGTLGGTCALPLALNNQGQVVGFSELSGNSTTHAFLWPGVDGTMKDLGTLGGSFSNPNDINDAGEVVGYAGDDSNQAVAFLWEKGVMINLGILAGDCASTATSVNSKGQIVGYSSTACDFTAVRRGVLWEHGSMMDLNRLIPAESDIHVSLAESINDRGEIAVNGTPAGCDLVEACGHAVLLIPCDENHPGIKDCDYSLAVGHTIVATNPVTTGTQSPTTANPRIPAMASPMTRLFGGRWMQWYRNPGVLVRSKENK